MKFSQIDIQFTLREKQLDSMMKCLEENEAEICLALSKDLRKCKQEAVTNEIELIRNELRNYAINLREYVKPEWVIIECYFHLNDNLKEIRF